MSLAHLGAESTVASWMSSVLFRPDPLLGAQRVQRTLLRNVLCPFRATRIRLVLAAVVALVMLSVDADADMRRFVGRILWLSGSELILAPPNGPSVRIDLTRLPQEDYRGLTGGDWVAVTGVIVLGRYVPYVRARSIERVQTWDVPSPWTLWEDRPHVSPGRGWWRQ
jgi:hypothetical protein